MSREKFDEVFSPGSSRKETPAVPPPQRGFFGSMFAFWRGLKVTIAVIGLIGVGAVLLIFAQKFAADPNNKPVTETQFRLIGGGMIFLGVLIAGYWISRTRNEDSPKTKRLEGLLQLLFFGAGAVGLPFLFWHDVKAIHLIQTQGREMTAEVKSVSSMPQYGMRHSTVVVQGKAVPVFLRFRELKPIPRTDAENKRKPKPPQRYEAITVLSVPGQPKVTIHANSKTPFLKRVSRRVVDDMRFMGLLAGWLVCAIASLFSLKKFLLPR